MNTLESAGSVRGISFTRIALQFLPFWVFLIFFKFGAGLHYSLVSPFGERLLPLWIVGVLMGGCSLIQLMLDVPAGHFLDRYGYLRFLKITTTVFLFAAAIYIFGLTTPIYLTSLAISIFGWLFFGPGINAYILSHAPKLHSGRFISLRDMFGSIGIVLASAFLPFILLFSPQQIGVILFTLLFIALVMLFFSPKDHFTLHEQKISTQHYYIKRHPPITVLKAVSKLNPASTMLLLLDLSGAIFYGIIWFVVPLVIAHQANSQLLGIGLGAFDFSIVVLGFILGNLADSANKRTLVFFGLLLFSVAAMILGFNFGVLFILFGFLATTGDEMAGISLWSWLHSLDKDHANDGLISGVINLFQDLGWAIGPIVAGVLYTFIGPTWTIVWGAVPIFVTWILYQFVVHTGSGKNREGGIPRKPHTRRHKI
jgi:MFS family permease